MTWQDHHRDRLCTAEEAVSIVEDGDRVIVPLTEQPMTLVRALAERAHEVSDATLTVSVPQFDLGPFIEAGWSVEIENFIGPLGRPYENEGLAPYSPLPFSLTFKANDERPDEAKPLDVVLAVAARPNQPGTDHLRTPVLVQARSRPARAEGRPRDQSRAHPHLWRRVHAR